MAAPLTRRNWLKRVLAAASAPAALHSAPAVLRSAPLRPNILLIISDDLAAWMLGCYGSPEIRTPHLDRLAAESVRFEYSFVCTPICSASRATLFTGRTPAQHGIHDFLTEKPIEKPPQGQAAPPESFRREEFFSDLLAARGYACGYAGKWHMGWDEQPQHGFDYWYLMPGGSSRYQDPVMLRQGRRVQERGYIGDLITGAATEFLEQQRSRSNPWLLVASYNNPHTPYDGHPQKYYDLYASEMFRSVPIEPTSPRSLREKNLMNDPIGNLRKAAAATTALDDQVAALLAHLRDRRLEQNTLVVFVGDNGFLHGRHGLYSKGLASDPINMYEEVMRVPLLCRWPAGGWSGGRVSQALVSFYDFFPTVLDVANISLPTGRRPGHSYRQLAAGKETRWSDAVFGYFRNTTMIRDAQYKLVWRNDGRGPNELYDLRADPTEHRDFIDDPARQPTRERLARRLETWLRRYS